MQYVVQITNSRNGKDISYLRNAVGGLIPALTEDINQAEVFPRENSAVQAAYELSDMHPDYEARAVPINISIADYG